MNKLKLLPYNTIMEVVRAQKEIVVGPNCNGWVVRNIGGSIAFVNGIQLQPPPGAGLSGESFSSGGNYGEIYVGRIQIQFAAGINPTVEIIQKFYLDESR